MIRAAAYFGMLPDEYLDRVSHRAFNKIHDFLLRDWGEPDRHDHYLMQLALLLSSLPAMVWGKAPPDFKLDQFKLPFVVRHVNPAEEEQESEQKQQYKTNLSKIARASWGIRLKAAAEQAGYPQSEQGKGETS